jgi:hypothetical protein
MALCHHFFLSRSTPRPTTTQETSVDAIQWSVSDPYGYSIHSTSPLGSHGPDNTQIAQPLVAVPSVVTPNGDPVFQYAEPQIQEQPGIRKELLSMIDEL